MRFVALALGVLAAVLTQPATLSAQAEPQQRVSRPTAQSPFMRVYGATPAPYGFVAFCERTPDECIATGRHEVRYDVTPSRLSDLDAVNRLVNRIIAPTTDLELYGTIEHWTMPIDKGDCEDYALLKRHLLIKRGWPSSALLLTVVRDERGDGHAVLTARTQHGDFILDNKQPDVKLWHQTGYQYVMRQSFVDPRLWMALGPEGNERAATAASNQRR